MLRPGSLLLWALALTLASCSSGEGSEGAGPVCGDLRAIYELPAPTASMSGDEVRQVLAETEAVNESVTRGEGEVRDAFRVLADRQEALLRFAADRAEERGSVGDLDQMVTDFEASAGARPEWSDAAEVLNARRRDCGLTNSGTVR